MSVFHSQVQAEVEDVVEPEEEVVEEVEEGDEGFVLKWCIAVFEQLYCNCEQMT
jgi:hypothetical protein